jgi:hypothetical protein
MSLHNRRNFLAGVIGTAVVVCAVGPAFGAVSWDKVAAGPNEVSTFENADNWEAADYDPPPPNPPGPELTPPGPDSSWFIEGNDDDPDTTTENEMRPGYNGTITLTTPRDGSSPANPKLGAGAIGGGHTNEVTRLIISTDVTITGLERIADGTISGTIRQMRVGQQDWTDDNVFPWGIVQQTTGTVNLEMADDPSRGDLLLSNDKAVSAGGIWEVGGDASLIVPTDVHIGAKANVKAPGNIFRVRGSDVGEVTVGDRFQVFSRTAQFDITEVNLGAGFRDKFNRGKSVVEFVLDSDGVTPITVEDNLDIGSIQQVTTPNLGTHNAIFPGFLRVKLSEPTAKGAGTYDPGNPGSGDVIVLFNADRITTAITAVPAGAEELLEGRFFEPDHTNDSGTSPHRALLDGFRINSDYAGAIYSWLVNYDLSDADDGTVEPAVILSGLQITGIPGDLNDDNALNELDRTALMNAIAAPPVSDYDLIGAAQHLYDLNADDFLNELDLETFNTHFLAPVGLTGDHNEDGIVDAADYVAWRKLNIDGPGGYDDWFENFGESSSGSGGAGGVPEPCCTMLAISAMAAICGVRRAGRA